MKYLLITLSLFGLFLLALQFGFLFQRTPARFAGVHSVKGFDATPVSPVGSTPTRFDSLFNQAYGENQAKLEQADNSGFATHLIVIILTALSTLTYHQYDWLRQRGPVLSQSTSLSWRC